MKSLPWTGGLIRVEQGLNISIRVPWPNRGKSLLVYIFNQNFKDILDQLDYFQLLYPKQISVLIMLLFQSSAKALNFLAIAGLPVNKMLNVNTLIYLYFIGSHDEFAL